MRCTELGSEERCIDRRCVIKRCRLFTEHDDRAAHVIMSYGVLTVGRHCYISHTQRGAASLHFPYLFIARGRH